MAKRKVLILIPQLEVAGAQKIGREIASHLDKSGWDIHLVFFYDKGGLLEEWQRELPCPVVCFGENLSESSGVEKIFRSLSAFGNLFKYLRKNKIRLLFTMTRFANIFGITIGALAGVPVRISSQRNVLASSALWIRVLDRLVANSQLTTRMVAVSNVVKDYCIQAGIRKDKVEVIRNGVDTQGFVDDRERKSYLQSYGLKNGDLIITTIGRLYHQKGHEILLQAVPHILEKYPEARFLWAGEGELKELLQSQVDSSGLADTIKLIGLEKEVGKLLAVTDIFLLPSLYEGMPNVVLEAMAARVPVIATDVGGTPELIKNSVTGLLIPPGDQDAICEAVNSLMRNEEEKMMMVENAFEFVSREFTIEKMLKSYMDLFDMAIHSGQDSQNE